MEVGRSSKASVDFYRQARKDNGFLRTMQTARMAQGEQHQATDHVCFMTVFNRTARLVEAQEFSTKVLHICGCFLVLQP
jgi:hypothetical protein